MMIKREAYTYSTHVVFSFLMIVCSFIISCHSANAHSTDTWALPDQLFQAMVLPALTRGGDIIIDNFEYWDSPLNHGWITNAPIYPIWGYHIGYGRAVTVLDTLQVSRVLNVYMPPSVFLPDLRRFSISKKVYSPDPNNRIIGPQNAYLSFKVRAPLSIEMFDCLTFVVEVILTDKECYWIRLIPREPYPDVEHCEETAILIRDPIDTPAQPGIIDVIIGRQYTDYTWHMIYVDLNRALRNALGISENQPTPLKSINSITIQGNRYRLDDIIFHRHDHIAAEPPYLYKIGPIFAQLFVPLRRIIYATDDFCAQNDVLIDPDEIRQAWIDDGIDPNTKDCTIPVLADQGMRLSDSNHAEDMLRFNAFIGKGGAHGSFASEMIHPLEVNPNDGCPLFLPAYYRLMGEDGEKVVSHACGCSHYSEGTFYYSPERVRYIELALQNAGYQYWPRIAVLEFLPQTLEDLIITVEVSDGRSADIETFPVSVVNFPVENYPPLMEDLDDQIAYVGELFTYPLSAVDPDSCIFSPASQHPSADQFSLTWRMTLGSLPSYQYGPWQEQLIDPVTGLISFFPQFEGIYPAVVMVTDSRGYYSIGEFAIHFINRGTWLNHPPVVLGDWDHPQVCRAGELFMLSEPTLDVVDPDGDKVYYTVNFGCIGTDANGNAIWTFQTQFPGFYAIHISAMDIRGGLTMFTIHLEVRPWWSM